MGAILGMRAVADVRGIGLGDGRNARRSGAKSARIGRTGSPHRRPTVVPTALFVTRWSWSTPSRAAFHLGSERQARVTSHGFAAGGKGPRSDINVTPLIDVVLVLIVFMVMVPKLLNQTQIDVPPKAPPTTTWPSRRRRRINWLRPSRKMVVSPSMAKRSRSTVWPKGSHPDSEPQQRRSSSLTLTMQRPMAMS